MAQELSRLSRAGTLSPAVLTEISADAFRNLEVQVRANTAIELEREVAKSRILEAAYAQVATARGFNPDVAISIVFGLKW